MLPTLLSKIEPYLPTQYKEIATHFSYVFVLRVVQQLIAFASFFFILHHIPKETIGHYHFVLSVVGLVSITSLPGVRMALMQSIARGHGGFFKIAIRYGFLGSCVGSLILLGMAGYYYFWVSDFIMACAFTIAAVLTPATKGLLVWKSSYVGAERFKMVSIMDAGGTLITSLFLMLSVLFYTSSHIILLSIALLVPALQNLILSAFEYRKYKNANKPEDGISEYGIKSSAYHVFPVLAQEIDRLSIYNFVSAGELAAYNIALKIPEVFKTIIRNLGGVIMPKLARTSHYTKKLGRIFTAISLAILIAVTIFSFTIFLDLFYWLTPEEYHYAARYAQVLLLSFAIGNFGFLKGRYIYSQKNIESNKKITIMSNLIKIFSMPFLVFFFHVWGAVIAVFIQRLFISVYVVFVIRKHHSDPAQQTEE